MMGRLAIGTAVACCDAWAPRAWHDLTMVVDVRQKTVRVNNRKSHFCFYLSDTTGKYVRKKNNITIMINNIKVTHKPIFIECSLFCSHTDMSYNGQQSEF